MAINLKKLKTKKGKPRPLNKLLDYLSSLMALLAVLGLGYLSFMFLNQLFSFRLGKIFNLEDQKFQKYKEMLEIEDRGEKKEEALKKIIGLENLNICVGGVDPDTLSPKEYVKAFTEGPCAPALISPGLNGSWLQVIIDCEELKKGDPKTFEACGWNSCNKNSFWSFFHRSPPKELRMWVPAVVAPHSILPATRNRAICFSGLYGPKLELVNGKVTLLKKPGLTVLPVGLTPETRPREKGGCGRGAMDNFRPLPMHVSAGDFLENLFKAYEHLGYRMGLSFQPYPYDFRLHYKEANMTDRMQGVITSMHSLFGKKVLVIGQSLGNLPVISTLWNMPQELKDKAVARYIGVAPPFLGAPSSLASLLGFDNFFVKNVFGVDFGFSNDIKLPVFPNLGSFYALFPKNTYIKDANEPYMKAIIQRAQSEKSGKPMTKGTIMDLFPPPTEVCAPYIKKRYTDKCVLGMFHPFYIAEVEGKKYTPNDISALLEEYSYKKKAKEIHEHYQDERFSTFPNPGVQTNVIYSTGFWSKISFKFNRNPKPITLKKKHYNADFWGRAGGDRLVTTISSLTPFIKWADEFRNGVKNSHPVSFGELCSVYNRRDSIFDPEEDFEEGRKEVKKSSYFGMKCGCDGTADKKSSGECAWHQYMIKNPNLIQFLTKSSVDGQRGSFSAEISKKPDSYFEGLYDNCDILNNLE